MSGFLASRQFGQWIPDHVRTVACTRSPSTGEHLLVFRFNGPSSRVRHDHEVSRSSITFAHRRKVVLRRPALAVPLT